MYLEGRAGARDAWILTGGTYNTVSYSNQRKLKIAPDEDPAVLSWDDVGNWNIRNVGWKSNDVIVEVQKQVQAGLHGDMAIYEVLAKMFKEQDACAG